jgi:hypothetical protein
MGFGISRYWNLKMARPNDWDFRAKEKMKMKAHFRGQFIFLAAIMLFVAGVGNAQTYSGQAYAVSAKVEVFNQPVVTTAVTDTGDLPNAGGNISLTSVGVNLPGGIVSVGSSNSSTSGGPAPGMTSQSAASVNNLNVGLLGAGITADAVSSTTSCACPGPLRLGNSVITNLVIAGNTILVTGDANQTITINLSNSRVLTVVINEQILLPRSITVNALHITLADPLGLTTTNVIVASARSGLNCLQTPTFSIYSGRGTGVRLREASLLTGDITTIVSDTGPLPTQGGDITSTTTGAGLAPILSTGVVVANTSGGIPGGNENTSQSDARVNNLQLTVLNSLPILPDVLNLTATVIESDTQCQCSLGIPTCTGDSTLVGLNVRVLGIVIPVVIDFTPNQTINIPVLGLGNITLIINEQFSAGPGDITVNALRVQIDVLPAILLATDIVIAHSHSDIVCGLLPSSANSSIAGRVTNGFGRAIPRTIVTVTDMQGVVRTALTNSFGHYQVEGLRTAQNYIVEPRAKGYEFVPITVTLNDDLIDVDFSPTSSPSSSPKKESSSPSSSEKKE